ncbi:MAG: FYDLN acid domain-containing protein [Rhodobacteraceae bacterium]|nr:FYDLN acid domain-containing protein [Paracoccaceae bacterium]
MPQPEWGRKHRCEDCGARFYDLERSAIKCPLCNKPVVVQSTDDVTSRRKRVAQAAASEINDDGHDGDDDDFDDVDGVESESLEDIQDLSTEDLE